MDALGDPSAHSHPQGKATWGQTFAAWSSYLKVITADVLVVCYLIHVQERSAVAAVKAKEKSAKYSV